MIFSKEHTDIISSVHISRDFPYTFHRTTPTSLKSYNNIISSLFQETFGRFGIPLNSKEPPSGNIVVLDLDKVFWSIFGEVFNGYILDSSPEPLRTTSLNSVPLGVVQMTGTPENLHVRLENREKIAKSNICSGSRL